MIIFSILQYIKTKTNSMKDLTLKDLAVEHDYYCSDMNHYRREASLEYNTFDEFYEEFHDANVDMNLVFRWDLRQNEESKTYSLEIFQIQQRKGIFKPIHISNFYEKDIPLLLEYLKPHTEKLKSIWKPLEF